MDQLVVALQSTRCLLTLNVIDNPVCEYQKYRYGHFILRDEEG